MKKILVLIGLGVLIFSCNKSDVTTNLPNINDTAFLKTAKSYFSSSQSQLSGIAEIADSFVYDSSHDMVQYIRYTYSSAIGSPISDSMEIAFSFGPNGGVPDSYTYTNIPEGITNEHHQLTYNTQYRIVKDTSMGGVGGRNFANYFTYSDSALTATTLFNGSTTAYLIDSLFISNGNATEDGNIAEERMYAPDSSGSADTLSADTYYTYFVFRSPVYHSIARAVAPLLRVLALSNGGTVEDAISVNVLNGFSSTTNGLPKGIIDISLTTDTSGRIVQAITDAPYQGQANFTYTYY